MLRAAVLSWRVPALRRLPMTFGWMAKRPIHREIDRWIGAYLADRRVRADVGRMMRGVDRRDLLAAADRLPRFDKPSLVVCGSASLIAGSALLTESLPTVMRPRAQGLADVAMNLAGALGGIAAGTTMAMASFATLALLAAAIMAPCLLVAGRTLARLRNDGSAVRP